MFGSQRLLSRLKLDWPSADQVAQRAGDVGIGACLFIAPLWFGGRHDLGRLLYVVAVAVAVIGVFSHAALEGRKLRIPPIVLCLMAAAIGLLTLQTFPLPDAIYQWLAPDLSSTLPLWSSTAWGTEWHTLSFSPAETREGLALLTAHTLLFLAVATRLQSLDDLRRLLSAIAYLAIGMALLAFAQYLASNGKLLWIYRHPLVEMGQFVQGTFSTRNHFAHLMALGLGPVCWLAIGEEQRRKFTSQSGDSTNWLRGLAMGGVALLVVATLASQSRGGAAALAVAILVIGIGYLRSGTLRLAQVTGLVGVVVIAIGGVSLFGYEQISGRMDDLVSGEVETLDSRGARRAIWAANAEAWQTSPLVGFGVGSHRDVYPLFFREKAFGKEFTHAESGYMQIASETGTAGLLLLLGTIGLCGWWLMKGFLGERDPSKLRLWAAIAPGLAASVVHSIVDFVWFIPGLFTVTMVLAACAMRLVQLPSEETAAVSSRRKHVATPLSAFLGTGVVTMLAALAVGTMIGPARGSLDWDRYLRCSAGLRGMAIQLAVNPKGVDPYLAETIVQNTIYSVELLQKVVEVDPANARAHLRLAGRLLQQFELEASQSENSMAIELIRGAALDGGFASQSEMLDWLERAFGPRATLLRLAHAHARRAVELAPLQGESYLYLATLSFLDRSGVEASSFVDQALAVRPYKGSVLFEAGRQRQLAGNEAEAIDLWEKSVRRPGSHQYKLVALLAGRVSAEAFLEALDPGPTVLNYAMKQYNLVGNDADRLALAKHAQKEALRAEAEGENPLALAYRWRQVSSTLRLLKKNDQAVEAAERAVLLAPHVFTMRLELAHALHMAERFDAADPHIRWCLARRTDIRYLHLWLADAAKRRTTVDKNRRSRRQLFATRPSGKAKMPDRTDKKNLPNEPTNRSAKRLDLKSTSFR